MEEKKQEDSHISSWKLIQFQAVRLSPSQSEQRMEG